MEKKRGWKEKKKIAFGKKPQRTIDFFPPLPGALLRTSHVQEGPALPFLLFISELTSLNIVLIRKYTGHTFYCKCSTLLNGSL